MQDTKRTKAQLIQKLTTLRQQLTELTAAHAACQQAEEALRQREAQFQQLLAQSIQGISVIRFDGTRVFANPAYAHMLGYDHPAELIGTPFLQQIDPADQDNARARLQAFWRGEIGSVRATYRAVKKDGSSAWFDHVSTLIFWEGETALLGTFIDISERQRLEREVLAISEQERQRIGQDLHDSLGQYLTGISLLSKTVEQQLIAQAHPATALAARIADLVSQTLIHMRHLTAGLWPVDLESRGLVQALQNLATMVENLFDVSCNVVSTSLPEFPPPTIALHLYRIVQEAVHNAIRHGQAKQIVIALSMTPAALTVTVQDDGLGLPEATPYEPGLGLRLMTYRADLIGACLHMHTRPHGGTVVTCIVPTTLPTPASAKRGTGTQS